MGGAHGNQVEELLVAVLAGRVVLLIILFIIITVVMVKENMWQIQKSLVDNKPSYEV